VRSTVLAWDFNGISHIAQLFTRCADKEKNKNYWYQKGNVPFGGGWEPDQPHYPIGQQIKKKRQKDDGHIPDLMKSD